LKCQFLHQRTFDSPASLHNRIILIQFIINIQSSFDLQSPVKIEKYLDCQTAVKEIRPTTEGLFISGVVIQTLEPLKDFFCYQP